jgi:alanine-glyoxylate transaminase/serine-glyoxylate transaminase/serine-pyruvate transaminase
MTPPGLAFVAANGKALGVHRQATMRTPYWDWSARITDLAYMKHCGTAPEHLMFGLRAALDMISEEGLDAVWQRHRLLAGATHAAVARWSEGGVLALNVTQAGHRAPSVTTVLVEQGAPAAITDYTRKVCGVTLGLAIGDLAGRAFRIAHMGHVNAPMVLGSLAAVEMALQALDIPHGKGGVAAAIAHLSATAQAA